MSNPLFADISSFQPQVDWPAYAAWSKIGDGFARVILRASQGVGVPDANFQSHWNGAVASGVEGIGIYHYAYPNLHPGASGAQEEADYFASVVANRLRPGDWLMLDLEQNEDESWALAFGQALRSKYATVPIWLYDSLSHILQYFHNPQLAQVFDLNVADWTGDPNSRPSCPAPWASYVCLQFTDRYNVPGIGFCDCNVYLGGAPVAIPAGPYVWPVVGKEIPSGTTPNQIATTFGLDWQADLLPINTDWATGYNPTLPIADGTEIKLPGYPAASAGPSKADQAVAALKAALASI